MTEEDAAPSVLTKRAVETRTDLSRSAVSVGRILDRLDDGDYIVRLVKRSGYWEISVATELTVRSAKLER